MAKVLYEKYIEQCENDMNNVEESYLCYNDYDD